MTSTPAVIDIHAHLVPRTFLQQLCDDPAQFPGVDVTRHEDTFRVAFNGGTPTRPVAPGLSDLQRRLGWMDDQGVDTQVVGGWLDIFGYDLDADEGHAWARALTDAIRAEISDQPRLTALGTVALQAPARAGEALISQVASGMPGAMIATRAGGHDLDEDTYAPFWQAADQCGAVVFLHPGFGGGSDRYHDFGLVNGLGRLEDTTVTLARLLYAGIPTRYPNAKIVVAHAGAALPYVLGRLARNHALNTDTTHDPVEAFSRLHFDSVVFDADCLNLLVGKAGADHVMLGSDYPFPIGDLEPTRVPRDAVEGEALDLMLSGNAARLFGQVTA